ncbi:MAG: aminotransferase class I/II-fold pyridoxal phosphate-dependent enzyme [Ardenticatenaceae bacterium]|nr:aminotransferase class I/II-fold pyridoxal phosphate-dependent enzyme [Ardenticatenaceae bacterium]
MSRPEYKPGLSIEDLPPELRQKQPLKLASNENPLGPSPKALAAMCEALGNSHLYPSKQLDGRLRQAIADYWGRGLTADHIILGNGGLDVLELAARHYLAAPTADCVHPRVTFPFLARYCGRAARPLCFYDLDPDTFAYEPEAVLTAVTPHTGLVYVCNPNNPTGTYMTASQLDHLLANLPPKALLLHDEAYYHFHDAPDFPDAIGHVLAGANLLIIHTFSKIYGMAGLRLGYGIARPDIIAALANLQRPFHVNNLTLLAGLAALQDEEHLQKTVVNNENGRSWLTQQLQTLGCHVWPSQTNFLMFSHERITADTIVTQMLQEAIIMRPAFGLANHIRLSIGTAEQNTRVIETLQKIIEKV